MIINKPSPFIELWIWAPLGVLLKSNIDVQQNRLELKKAQEKARIAFITRHQMPKQWFCDSNNWFHEHAAEQCTLNNLNTNIYSYLGLMLVKVLIYI